MQGAGRCGGDARASAASPARNFSTARSCGACLRNGVALNPQRDPRLAAHGAVVRRGDGASAAGARSHAFTQAPCIYRLYPQDPKQCGPNAAPPSRPRPVGCRASPSWGNRSPIAWFYPAVGFGCVQKRTGCTEDGLAACQCQPARRGEERRGCLRRGRGRLANMPAYVRAGPARRSGSARASVPRAEARSTPQAPPGTPPALVPCARRGFGSGPSPFAHTASPSRETLSAFAR